MRRLRQQLVRDHHAPLPVELVQTIRPKGRGELERAATQAPSHCWSRCCFCQVCLAPPKTQKGGIAAQRRQRGALSQVRHEDKEPLCGRVQEPLRGKVVHDDDVMSSASRASSNKQGAAGTTKRGTCRGRSAGSQSATTEG
eukprot:4703468-Lingulodinium_polyedra.AAC.1